MPLPAGTRLGPYEIVAPLGAGGMGEVYRALDTRLGREVAVKLLAAALAQDAAALRRFELEARAVAALNHPNLLTIHDVGTTAAGSLYLVTELLEGDTLRQRLAAGGLGQRLAVEYGVQIARGLAAAHDKGLVHRDLKPENIFCTLDGRVKILDFGLAKLAEVAAADGKTALGPEPAFGGAQPATAAGVVLGTVGYMAPEQARGQATDHRSDIFSLGAVLYEMVSGRRAFRGDTAADVISAILREDPPELATGTSTASATAAAPSPAIERIIRHCLEKEPRQRYQSSSDVAFSLADLSSATSTSTSSGFAAMSAAPPNLAARRWRIAFAAACLSGLAVAAAAVWLASHARSAPPQFKKITYREGTLRNARFLPDGQSVLGVAMSSANTPQLFSARLDSVGMQPLSAPVSEVLAVAPGEAAVLQDVHKMIGYTYFGTLARLPLSGGAPRPLLEHVQFADYSPSRGDLAITRYQVDSSTFTLEYPIGHVLVRSSGWIGDPRFSRDGTRIAYLLHLVLGDNQGSVAVVDLKGRQTILTRRYAAAQGLAWSPSDQEIWFSAADNTQLALRAVSLHGRDRLLQEAPGGLLLQDVLADGRALVTSNRIRDALDIVTPEHPQPRDFTVLDWNESSVLSADGQQVLVGDEDAGPLYATYLRNPDGSPPVRLGDGDPVAISPDGKWAASVLPSNQQIELLPLGAGDPRLLTHGPVVFVSVHAAWLPNGQGILAIGIAPGREPRSYLISLDGAVKPVTPEGIVGSLPTPDSRGVLASDFRAHALNEIYPLAGGPPQPLPALLAGDSALRFTADGQSLYVARAPSAPTDTPAAEVWKVNLAPRQRERLFVATPDGAAGVTGIVVTAISADGKTYLVSYARDLDTLYLVTGLR